MLVAAAVCPCPPLLVPQVAAGAAGEMDEVRGACANALAELAAARPDRLVVIGPDETQPEADAKSAPLLHYEQGSTGSMRSFGLAAGAARPFQLGDGPGDGRELPASLTVGAWLLEEVSWEAAPVTGYGVPPQLPRARCLEAGRSLTVGDDRVALLVLGDGSACRTVKAPGYLDERATSFDAAVAAALAAADTSALREMDSELAEELLVGGRAGWQVLAGAAQNAGLRGSLLHDSAPYGVGYLVAVWS